MAIADDLKFIVGAVARKDYAEELCHLLIKDGRVIAYDGLLSMSSSIDISLHVKPNAKMFIEAIRAAPEDETFALSTTKAGRLSFKAGKFKAFIDCLDNEKEMTQPLPEGDDVEITDALFDSILAVSPFMSIDASRPWAMGVMIKGDSTWATNNIIFVERWHGSKFGHEIILPAPAVNELIRIGKRPTRVQITDSSATFWFGENRWLRTALIDGKWPETIDRVFEPKPDLEPLNAEFFEALKTIKGFISKERRCVHLLPNRLATTNEDSLGASVDIDLPRGAGQIFNHEMLSLLEGVASRIDFTQFPNPCQFFGDKLRGVILGMRQ